jgi:hypothetical protein
MGSFPDLSGRNRDVRFTPISRHRQHDRLHREGSPARSSDCRGTDHHHLVPCMNACISSRVSLPSLLLSIALKILS